MALARQGFALLGPIGDSTWPGRLVARADDLQHRDSLHGSISIEDLDVVFPHFERHRFLFGFFTLHNARSDRCYSRRCRRTVSSALLDHDIRQAILLLDEDTILDRYD